MSPDWRWAAAGLLVALSRLDAGTTAAAIPALAHPLGPLHVGALVALLAIPGLALAAWAWWRNPQPPEVACVAGLVALVGARIVADPPVLVVAAWSGTVLFVTPRPETTQWNPRLVVGGVVAAAAALLALQPWTSAPAPLSALLLVLTLALGRALVVRMEDILHGASIPWALGVLVPFGAMVSPGSAPLVLAAAGLEAAGCWLAARWKLGAMPWAASSVLGLGVLLWR